MIIFPKLSAVLAIAILVSGCATITAPTYTPHYESIDRLKKNNIEKMSLGEVQPRDPSASVNKIKLRAAVLVSSNGTFANYLESAIRSDLMEMGLYDPTSTTQVDASLIKNDINISGFNTGYGEMEVMLRVSKKDGPKFEKVYSVNTQFESSFVGAVAIPKGQNEYPNLVRALLQKVYVDPAFIEAVKK